MGLLVSPYRLAVAASFPVSAVNFDGTNDGMNLGAGLAGAVDNKQGLISLWVKHNGSAGIRERYQVSVQATGSATQRHYAEKNAVDQFEITARNTGSTEILNIHSSALSLGSWTHLIASWDLSNSSKRHLYVNGTSDLTVVTYTNDTIDWTFGDWYIGQQGSGIQRLNADLAEFYFTTTYLDLSVQSNRELFRSPAGKPVNLGSDGSTPLGSQPLIYLHGPSGSFDDNFGSAGAFTVIGALTDSSSSPSD